jgi:hypothetical protein
MSSSVRIVEAHARFVFHNRFTSPSGHHQRSSKISMACAAARVEFDCPSQLLDGSLDVARRQ